MGVMGGMGGHTPRVRFVIMYVYHIFRGIIPRVLWSLYGNEQVGGRFRHIPEKGEKEHSGRLKLKVSRYRQQRSLQWKRSRTQNRGDTWIRATPN